MSRVPVALCLDTPEAIRPALLYAAEELLRPLACAPHLVPREDVGKAGIYVGPEPETVASGAIRIRQRPETVDALLHERAVSLEAVSWLRQGGGEVPLPFPLGGGTPEADPTWIVEADVLASAFWWLAGVQERANRTRDRWGRVPYAASLQAALDAPLATPVDAIRAWFASALRARGVAVREMLWGGHAWAVALTHDLDALRTPRLRAFAGDAARGRLWRAARRGFGPDARAVSARALIDLARRHGARSTLFVKTGASSPEDLAPHVDAAWLRALAADGFEIGLHPSMEAATDSARLWRERQRLGQVLGESPQAVRSHYLRWDPALTPSLYAAEGFATDSTLGWAATPGFRRGTAHPFRLWDAARSAPSSLWEAPLAVMDTTLFAHRGLSPEAASAALADALGAARASGGLAVVLWHNAMGDLQPWASTLSVIDHAIGRARAEGAALLPLERAVQAAKGYSL
ncbi:hypothetical protein [Rubricoccus marinus]|uniref:NodB homology domain-containing protein n=1 Tax=Rubricoccus marinus TaxID=716817 RepID=A0A259TZ90_9BACT|nr:hypothetical protein [Rubricoccus marinus]OZC03072.1 hypothetical protein BSZ36_08870 [Rubricoccus marinus]